MSEKFDVRRISRHRTKHPFILTRAGDPELCVSIAPKHRNQGLKAFDDFQSSDKEEIRNLGGHICFGWLIERPPGREVWQFSDRPLQTHLTMLLHGEFARSDEQIYMIHRLLDHPRIS